MGEYFKPLRRKVGVVTLLMACAFVLGWVRSLFSEDEIRLEIDPQAFYVVVSERQLLTFRYLFDRQAPPRPWVAFPHLSWGTSPLSSQLLFDMPITWRFHWLEFGLGNATRNDHRYFIWIIPYWSIVIPLTLFSAWMLLIKPRESNQTKITEAIADEGK